MTANDWVQRPRLLLTVTFHHFLNTVEEPVKDARFCATFWALSFAQQVKARTAGTTVKSISAAQTSFVVEADEVSKVLLRS